MTTPSFAVAAVGDNAKKVTLLTSDRRTFYKLDGADVVVEGGMHTLLRDALASSQSRTLAAQLRLDENRIMRVRQALDMPDGRTLAVKPLTGTEPAHFPLNQVVVIGDERSAIVVVAAPATSWARVPETRLLYESRLKEVIRRWLLGTDNVSAASELDVSMARIVTMRKYFRANLR